MKNKNPKERNSKVEIELDEDEIYVPNDWYEEEEEDVFEMLSYEERLKFIYSEPNELEEHKEYETHRNKEDDNLPV